jgi:hypothetical protein
MKIVIRVHTMLILCLFIGVSCSYDETTAVDLNIKIPAANDPGNFPLKVSEGKLVTQSGQQFLIVGDSPWYLMQKLDRSSTDKYLENRHAKGVNSLILCMIASPMVGSENIYGENPFLENLDFLKPNPVYFDHVDYIIKKAEKEGIAMFLFPAYLGYDMGDNHPEGFYEAMIANGPAKMYEYGRFIGNRYKDYSNIVWVMGGDASPDEALDEIRAMVKGIQETTNNQIFTVHNGRYSSGVTEYNGDNWIDLNSTYADYLTAAEYLLKDYNRKYPFYFIEGTYENTIHNDIYVRSQMYTPVLLGSQGYFYGNEKQYPFDTGWESQLESQGSKDLERSSKFFRSRDWFNLEPDVAGTFLVSGAGDLSSPDFAPAAVTQDGITGIIYTPDNRELMVDLTRIKGPKSHGWWYQPSTGSVTDIGIIDDAVDASFMPPMEGDWLLVLDDASQALPKPGTSL